MDADLPRNRLGLARWLVDPSNPLTARVVVNRWWGDLLGRPIVATPEDFGLRGSRPTHPKLLDWLATELVQVDWSRKRLLREIVTSATYQQSAVPADLATLERDPENRLLGRNPRRRIAAEAVRDNALTIAGLLSPTQGGPPVNPPQPPGVWRSNGATPARYVPSEGEDARRRGVYTVWRRTSPYPSFVNFDAGDRTACVVRRSLSNTPLQALTLLNDEVYSDAALAFADRILRERPDASTEDRIDHAFRIALARAPSAEETAALRTFLDERVRRVDADPAAVQKITAGRSGFALRADIDRPALAAWFYLARVLLNLDETITRG